MCTNNGNGSGNVTEAQPEPEPDYDIDKLAEELEKLEKSEDDN